MARDYQPARRHSSRLSQAHDGPEDLEATAALEAEAAGAHLASDDYPEMGDILRERPDPGSVITVVGALQGPVTAAATYGRPDDARDDDYNGGPADSGTYWAEPAQQQWRDDNLGPQEEAPPPPWAPSVMDSPVMARLAQMEEARHLFGALAPHGAPARHCATTINGTQVDDHGDAPAHGTVPRASAPDSYDGRSTEGDGDPKWSDPVDPAHKKIFNGATVGMFPEGISSGNGPGLPIGPVVAHGPAQRSPYEMEQHLIGEHGVSPADLSALRLRAWNTYPEELERAHARVVGGSPVDDWYGEPVVVHQRPMNHTELQDHLYRQHGTLMTGGHSPYELLREHTLQHARAEYPPGERHGMALPEDEGPNVHDMASWSAHEGPIDPVFGARQVVARVPWTGAERGTLHSWQAAPTGTWGDFVPSGDFTGRGARQSEEAREEREDERARVLRSEGSDRWSGRWRAPFDAGDPAWHGIIDYHDPEDASGLPGTAERPWDPGSHGYAVAAPGDHDDVIGYEHPGPFGHTLSHVAAFGPDPAEEARARDHLLRHHGWTAENADRAEGRGDRLSDMHGTLHEMGMASHQHDDPAEEARQREISDRFGDPYQADPRRGHPGQGGTRFEDPGEAIANAAPRDWEGIHSRMPLSAWSMRREAAGEELSDEYWHYHLRKGHDLDDEAISRVQRSGMRPGDYHERLHGMGLEDHRHPGGPEEAREHEREQSLANMFGPDIRNIKGKTRPEGYSLANPPHGGASGGDPMIGIIRSTPAGLPAHPDEWEYHDPARFKRMMSALDPPHPHDDDSSILDAGPSEGDEGFTRAHGDGEAAWYQPVAARGDARGEVIAQLEEDYPPDALEWLRHASVTGPRYVPLRDIDWSDRHAWTSYRQPRRVAGFLDTMTRKAAAGKKLKPALVVSTPGGRAFIGDGHHRGLAQLLGASRGVWAYVATVSETEGPWDTMHGRQLRAPSKDEGSTARISGPDAPPDEVADFQGRVDQAVSDLDEHYGDENSLEDGDVLPDSSAGSADNYGGQQAAQPGLSGNVPRSSGDVRKWPLAGAPVTETGPAKTQGRNDGRVKRSRQAHLDAFVAATASAGFRFEFTATWHDVVAKAKRIRAEGHVRITHASAGMVIGEVRGDHDTYESGIQRPPGRPQTIQHWACGCPWASFHQDKSLGTRYAGRPCSHVMALQYEAQARGMFGKSVARDEQAPAWGGRDVVVKSWPPYEGEPHRGHWTDYWLAPSASLRHADGAGGYTYRGTGQDIISEYEPHHQMTGRGWETEVVPNPHFVAAPANAEGGVTHLVRGYVNGQPAGSIGVGASNNLAAWKVHNVHVAPGYRGTGTAHALMDALYDHARAAGGQWVDPGRKVRGEDLWHDYSEPHPEMNIHNSHPESGWNRYFNVPRVHREMEENSRNFPDTSPSPSWRPTEDLNFAVHPNWSKARGLPVTPRRGTWPGEPVNEAYVPERGAEHRTMPATGPWREPHRVPEPEDRYNFGVTIGGLHQATPDEARDAGWTPEERDAWDSQDHPQDDPQDQHASCYYRHEGPCPGPGMDRTAESLRHPRPRGFRSEITRNPKFDPGSYWGDDASTHVMNGYVGGQLAGQLHFSRSDDGKAYHVGMLHSFPLESGKRVKGVASALMDDLYSHVRRNGQWLSHGQRTKAGNGWWASYQEPHPEVNVHHAHPDEGWRDYFSPRMIAEDMAENFSGSEGRGVHSRLTWLPSDYPDDEREEMWTRALGRQPPAREATAALLAAGEPPGELAALAALVRTADQANAPWGSENVSKHPPVKPYGATEPLNRDQSPASYGFLSAPDPDNWGGIQDDITQQMPLSNTAAHQVLAPTGRGPLPPDLRYPDVGDFHEDQESFGWTDRANTAGPSTSVTPRDPGGIRMEEAARDRGHPLEPSWGPEPLSPVRTEQRHNWLSYHLMYEHAGDGYSRAQERQAQGMTGDQLSQLHQDVHDAAMRRDDSSPDESRWFPHPGPIDPVFGSRKDCPCCNGAGEHATGRECYGCDASGSAEGYSGSVPCDGTKPYGTDSQGHQVELDPLDGWQHLDGSVSEDDGSVITDRPVKTASGTPFPYHGEIPQLDGALAELRDHPEPALPSTTGDDEIARTAAQENFDDFRCDDCGEIVSHGRWEPGKAYESYMVHSPVWQQAGMARGHLCIGCLESRLGRQLTRHDFPEVPVNSLDPKWSDYAWSDRTERLRDRLTRESAADGTIGGGSAGDGGEDQSPSAVADLGEFGAVHNRPDPSASVRGQFRRKFGGTPMGDLSRETSPQAQQPSMVAQQPGMGSFDEPLMPDDQSIQTVGNQQWSGGGTESDETVVTPGQPQGSIDDIVASFQRSAAARQFSGGGGGAMADGDIASAARDYLSKTADVLPEAEAAALIAEGRGQRARNLSLLRLEGTHYEDEDEDLARRGVSLDDYDDDVISV